MKIKNIILLSFFFFSIPKLYTQNTMKGVAIYSKKIIPSKTSRETTDKEKMLIDLVNEEITNASKKIEYELSFNKNRSIFNLIESLDTDSNAEKLAATSSGGKGTYYMNFIDNEVINKVGNFGEDFLIYSKISSLQWKTTSESKKIGKYICYKAFCEQKRESIKGVYIVHIIAWYCPLIPVSSGPVGYGGLPGLILELNHNNNAIYKLKELRLNSNEDFTYKKPTKGKKISIKEYDDIAIEIIKKRLN